MRLSLDLGLGSVATLGDGGGYSAEASALFARFTTPPDATRKTLINSTIVALKAAGLWADLSFIHFHAAHDEQAGRMGWKSSTYNLTASGSPTFTVDRGFSGDGLAAWLSTGVANNAIANWTQDSASVATWETSNVAEAAWAIGSSTSGQLRTFGRDATDLRGGRVNSTSASTTVAETDGRGLTAIRRTAGPTQEVFKNGALVATSAGSSLAPNTGIVGYLRGVSTFSTRRVGFGCGGPPLTVQQHADLYTIVNTYMTAIGAA